MKILIDAKVFWIMNLFYLLILPLMISFFPVYAPSHPEYSGIDNSLSYTLQVDEHTFDISYHVDADVIAMATDQELTSLLIGIENTYDSFFVIDLKHEIITAYNNEFAILVNGLEVDYEIVSDADSTTFTFFVPEGTEEVEIIGTHVIPEFPIGIIVILSILFTITTVFSRINSGRNFI